jgi:hypothetical protein
MFLKILASPTIVKIWNLKTLDLVHVKTLASPNWKSIRYNTIETTRIGYNRFLFLHDYECGSYNFENKKKSCENSFVCEWVYLIFLLYIGQILKLVHKKNCKNIGL